MAIAERPLSKMALLRFLSSPPTTCFPLERQLPFSNSHSHLSVSCSLHSLFPLSYDTNNSRTKLPLKTKRDSTHFVLHFSSTAQEQALVSTESGELDSEVLKDKLYAQNVPWDCTPEDIRALFEKYGTVKDVEVQKQKLYYFRS